MRRRAKKFVVEISRVKYSPSSSSSSKSCLQLDGPTLEFPLLLEKTVVWSKNRD